MLTLNERSIASNGQPWLGVRADVINYAKLGVGIFKSLIQTYGVLNFGLSNRGGNSSLQL